MNAPIVIADYNPQWPQQFELRRSRIAFALGPLAAAIELIGSTAVPGLSAKPIIDIDVLLHAATDLPEAITRLATQGYQHQGNLGIPGREAFGPPPDGLPHHLYVCVPECLEYARHITFRDHLRVYPEDASAYKRLKRTLAGQYRNDREAYNQAKAEFVEVILRRANARTEHSRVSGRIIP